MPGTATNGAEKVEKSELNTGAIVISLFMIIMLGAMLPVLDNIWKRFEPGPIHEI